MPNNLNILKGFLISFFLLLISKIPLLFILKQLRWILLFLGLFFFILPFSIPGERFYFISLNGLEIAFVITLRALSICILIFPMIGSMKFHTTLKALSGLRIPNKIVQLFIFSYRYIFVFIEDFSKMIISTKARLFKRKSIIYTLKIYSNLIGMLFIRGFEKTERIYQSMWARGYKGELRINNEFKLSFKDILKALLIILLSIFIHI
jgi:cobalt/nickel transport system permease protein